MNSLKKGGENAKHPRAMLNLANMYAAPSGDGVPQDQDLNQALRWCHNDYEDEDNGI